MGDTLSLDEKGRVVIPQSMRDALNLKSGEKLLASLDPSGAILLEPAHEKQLLRLEISLSDQPGSLAKAAMALAKIKVDLVSTSSRSSRRGEQAVWSVQCNPGAVGMNAIKKALSTAGATVLSSSWN